MSSGLLSAAKRVQSAGRHGDGILAHISAREAQELKNQGGAGSRNPKTGLLEFFDQEGPGDSGNSGSGGLGGSGDREGGGHGSDGTGGLGGDGGAGAPGESPSGGSGRSVGSAIGAQLASDIARGALDPPGSSSNLNSLAREYAAMNSFNNLGLSTGGFQSPASLSSMSIDPATGNVVGSDKKGYSSPEIDMINSAVNPSIGDRVLGGIAGMFGLQPDTKLDNTGHPFGSWGFDPVALGTSVIPGSPAIGMAIGALNKGLDRPLEMDLTGRPGQLQGIAASGVPLGMGSQLANAVGVDFGQRGFGGRASLGNDPSTGKASGTSPAGSPGVPGGVPGSSPVGTGGNLGNLSEGPSASPPGLLGQLGPPSAPAPDPSLSGPATDPYAQIPGYRPGLKPLGANGQPLDPATARFAGGTLIKSWGPALAAGGLIRGAGTPTSDSIPANLSNGEFVVPAAAVKKYLPILESMRQEANSTKQNYAAGGIVSPDEMAQVRAENLNYDEMKQALDNNVAQNHQDLTGAQKLLEGAPVNPQDPNSIKAYLDNLNGYTGALNTSGKLNDYYDQLLNMGQNQSASFAKRLVETLKTNKRAPSSSQPEPDLDYKGYSRGGLVSYLTNKN